MGHYILIMYTLNNRATKYVTSTQIELKGEIDKYTIIVRDFNTPLTIIDETRQKISKNIGECNSITG